MTVPKTEDEPTLAEQLYLEFVAAEELPEAAMREAVAAWDECRGFFLEAFAGHAEGRWELSAAGDALFFLAHLFGQMRETAASRPLLKLLARPIEELEESLGDTLELSLARILVGVFDGDAEPLEAMMLDPSVHEFARWPIIDAYAALAKAGRIDRDRAVRVLLAISPEVVPADDASWVGWMTAAAALDEPALVAAARARLASGAIAVPGYDAKDLEAEIAARAADPDAPLDALRPIVDAAEELSHWHGFSAAGVAERRKAAARGGSIGRDTHVNPYRNVGRNDPCPCGSGRKFKKCHGA